MPTDGNEAYHMGLCCLERGKYDGAIKCGLKAIQANEKVTVYNGLATYHVLADCHAFVGYCYYLRADVSKADPYKKDMKGAVDSLVKAIQFNSQNTDYVDDLLLCCETRESCLIVDGVVKSLQDLDSWVRIVIEAACEIGFKQYDSATQRCTDAICGIGVKRWNKDNGAVEAKIARMYALRGRARYLERGSLDADITSDFKQALALDPNCLEVYKYLGHCYSKAGDVKNADLCYETFVRLENGNYGLGEIKRRAGQGCYALEIAYLKVAIEREPDNVKCGEYYNEMGVRYHNNKRYSEALECLKKAIEKNDGRVLYITNACIACYELKQFESAREYLKKAEKIDPNNKGNEYLERVKSQLAVMAQEPPQR